MNLKEKLINSLFLHIVIDLSKKVRYICIEIAINRSDIMDTMHKHLLADSELSLNTIKIQHKAYLGDADAQYSLANIFQKGFGVAKNPNHAFYWYKKSANQGNIAAQFNVWYAYLTGDGVEENLEKSDSWYRTASLNNVSTCGGESVVDKLLRTL